MADLTERLAAAITRTGKKITTTEVRNARWIQEVAPIILPLLLSEPELVAWLPEATKAALLRTLLGERLATFGAAVAMPNAYQTYGNGFPVSVPVLVEAVLEILAPEAR